MLLKKWQRLDREAKIMQLDHVVINVRADMDAAEIEFGNLGFTITPRGFHTLGSINHLMIFETDYLELIGVPEGGETKRADLLTAPLGINGLVFKSEDVDLTFKKLKELGMDGEPPRSFSRPVEIDGTMVDAKFRTVSVRPDVFPEGRVYFCEHGTPELVWRKEWQSHKNKITAVAEMVVVTTTVTETAKNYADLVGSEVEMLTNGVGAVATADILITVCSPAQYRDRYGESASDLGNRSSMFGALVFTSRETSSVVRLPVYDSVLEFKN